MCLCDVWMAPLALECDLLLLILFFLQCFEHRFHIVSVPHQPLFANMATNILVVFFTTLVFPPPYFITPLIINSNKFFTSQLHCRIFFRVKLKMCFSSLMPCINTWMLGSFWVRLSESSQCVMCDQLALSETFSCPDLLSAVDSAFPCNMCWKYQPIPRKKPWPSPCFF